METAKVDIRKLQLLNDRINQCIDALSQVRLSVHGLSGPQAAPGWGGYGQLPGQFPGALGVSGLSHTGALGNPFLAQPFGAPMGVGLPGIPATPFGPAGGGINPFVAQMTPGLSHSTGPWPQTPTFGLGASPYGYGGYGVGAEVDPVTRAGVTDPLLTARIAQTFPYAQFAVPPVISIY